VLHVGDEEGCEKACYECLLTFYNQRDHDILDRTLVLPFLESMSTLNVQAAQDSRERRLSALREKCESSLEAEILKAIDEQGLPLPDAAQKTIYEGDAPLAEADFYYDPKVVVFVDGSPHHKDYVEAADREKRLRLKRAGYRIVVVESPSDLEVLEARVG
jgi:hypothetical protein